MLGESADSHKNHKATLETRMEFLEKTMGDNAEKHVKELAAHAAKSAKELAAHGEKHGLTDRKLSGLETAMNGFAKSEQHATILARMEYLEKMVGESAGDHKNHKATLETRMEFLEKMVGDNAEKHAKELAAHAAKNAENVDKHAKDLSAHADKHAKDLTAHAEKHGLTDKKVSGLEAAMNGFAKSEQHATMLQRMEYLEKMLGESAGDHKNHKATLEMRMEFLEKTVGDTAEKHAKELAAHAAKNAENVEKHAKDLAAH